MKRIIGRLAIALAATLAVFTVILAAMSIASDKPALSYRTLDYDVTIQSDGSLRIVQHIDMRLRPRSGGLPWKQLYQQYALSPDQLTDITDISVTNADTGEAYRQGEPAMPSDWDDAEWNAEWAGSWYIADVSDSSNPTAYIPGTDGYAIPSYATDEGSSSSGSSFSSDSKTIEIGWNIPATEKASHMRFDVAMTWHGTTRLYDDVASFQWEPFGTSNPTPIGKVTGTVRFPDGTDQSDSWAWLHHEGDSQTSRDADNTLRFTAWDVRAGDYLDLVAAWGAGTLKAPDGWDEKKDGNWIQRRDGNWLPSLQANENEQEQAWRAQQRAKATRALVIWSAAIIIGLALTATAIVDALRSRRAARYHGDMEYWREPPDMSPASAATLADALDLDRTLRLHAKGTVETRQLTATILSLASKKALAIYPGPAGLYDGLDLHGLGDAAVAATIGTDPAKQARLGQTLTISLNPDALAKGGGKRHHLSPSESAALQLLREASKRIGATTFDLDQMRDMCGHWKRGHRQMAHFSRACDNEYAMLGVTRPGGRVAAFAGTMGVLMGLAMAVAALATAGNVALMLAGAPVTAGSLFALLIASYHAVTPAGQRLAGQVQGLCRYLVDYSDFTDRGAADLALWDRYLVYAAAFGITGRAMEQLAKAWPQLMDRDWLDGNASGSLLYWNYRVAGWRHGYMYGTAVGSGVAGAGAGPAMGADADGTARFGGADASALGAGFGGFDDLGLQLDAGFASIRATIDAAMPHDSGFSGGSGGFGGSGSGSGGFGFGGSGGFSGGGFGGSSGGSGGGSFGGR